jgi:hypothetical protein
VSECRCYFESCDAEPCGYDDTIARYVLANTQELVEMVQRVEERLERLERVVGAPTPAARAAVSGDAD